MRGEYGLDYANGKIYIVTADGKTAYVGSTTRRYLSNRYCLHTYRYRKRQCTTLDPILCEPAAHIKLLEEWPCTSVDELREREQYWMDKLRADGVRLVNRRRAAKPD